MTALPALSTEGALEVWSRLVSSGLSVSVACVPRYGGQHWTVNVREPVSGAEFKVTSSARGGFTHAIATAVYESLVRGWYKP